MAFKDNELRRIYARTDGRCHVCRKKCSFKNYGALGARGAWHVDHSIPVAAGGTSHGNNLYIACIACNTSKQASSTRSQRAIHGHTRAPLSRSRKDEIRSRNTVLAGGAGALVGFAIAGPPGAALLAVVGGALGHATDVD